MLTSVRSAVSVAVLSMLVACGPGEPPLAPELEQGMQVVRYLSSPRFLRKSAFREQEDRTPSSLVSYLFSDMGIAEWPEREGWGSDLAEEQMRSIGVPMVPADVGFYPHRPESAGGMQIVVHGEDATREIVVRAYEDPAAPPVAERRWPMPRFRDE